MKDQDHFQGKNPFDHVMEARKKGIQVSAENHGIETPGHYSAAIDATRETIVIILIGWTLFFSLDLNPKPFLPALFSLMVGWVLWKTLRSALLGWSRLERLHRLIEEERWEIQHHRPQEKEELKALYELKGFSGKMLHEVVEVLMSDDDRLLRVMIEEEFGLQLESYEHPLKQSLAAGGAVLITSLILLGSLATLPFMMTPILGISLILFVAGLYAHFEKNRILPAIVWNLSGLLFAMTTSYFMAQILS